MHTLRVYIYIYISCIYIYWCVYIYIGVCIYIAKCKYTCIYIIIATRGSCTTQGWFSEPNVSNWPNPIKYRIISYPHHIIIIWYPIISPYLSPFRHWTSLDLLPRVFTSCLEVSILLSAVSRSWSHKGEVILKTQWRSPTCFSILYYRSLQHLQASGLRC